VLDEGPSRLRQPDRAGTALHERDARLALERGDLLRDRRGCERERLGGSCDRASFGHLSEDTHAANIEHKRSLTDDEASSVAMMLRSWQRFGW
jgi:hypothetical protein